MSKRVFNFGAGPCTLPLPVLEEAQKEFTNFSDSGMSVIELSHRSKEYDAVHQEAMTLSKEVFGVPDEFEVMFIQGGATLQFSMIPMNLLQEGQKAAYVNCGAWSKKAIADAKVYGDIYLAWDGSEENFIRMPKAEEYALSENTRYLHITSNETIGGIRMTEWPEVDVPLVADMSSDYMSRSIPWEKFDLVYGGAQKNLGPAGMAIVFIRKSICAEENKNLGSYLRYDLHCGKESLYNTPPVFSIYMMGKVLKWMKSQGGLEGMEKSAIEKSGTIYDVIDNSDGYFNNPVDEASRSWMNIVFRLPSEELEQKLIKEATAAGIIGLKGHKSVGGCRASCYNSLPMEGVKALKEFMELFQKNNPA
ncbi:MAG: 3-phosphoserine/phosphohydroxythreonine aminotransferase [Planctomycetota bacterium]|nr:MAG: 3-phosphoserine/phosphohydroxythreonine aminotransferase [Planctomycetota bacterium]